MPRMLAKNTLTYKETKNLICFFALSHLKAHTESNSYLNAGQRIAVWKLSKHFGIYSGDCSHWHANKIEMCGLNVAQHCVSVGDNFYIYDAYGIILEENIDVEIAQNYYLSCLYDDLHDIATKCIQVNNISYAGLAEDDL